MKNTYLIEDLGGFIIINFRGPNWKFKESGQNVEGLSEEEIEHVIEIMVEENKINKTI